MTDNVRHIYGLPIVPEQKEAIPLVVETIEELLEMAKRGDIVGFAYALTDGDDIAGFGRFGLIDDQIALSLHDLVHMVMEARMSERFHD